MRLLKGGKMFRKEHDKKANEQPDANLAEELASARLTIEELVAKNAVLEEEKAKLETSFTAQLNDNRRIVQIAEREKGQIAEKTKKDLAGHLISVADDLERALSMLSDVGNDATCKAPVQFILESLSKAFVEIGLSEINPMGEFFDPHSFEFGGSEDSDEPDGVVCKVLRKGYSIGGQIIRSPLVVCSANKKTMEETNEQNNRN